MSGAPSDGRSVLSFAIVIIRPLLVIYTDLLVMHMLVTYTNIYNMYKPYVSPGWEQLFLK
jgi:hypothetical protein